MNTKLVAILMIFPFLVSCQALSTSMAVIGESAACSGSKAEQDFPSVNSKKYINVRFNIKQSDSLLSFNETAECKYQGSICGGGSWFDVWYGDQTTPAIEVHLENGDLLSFREHSQCIHINEYMKECINGECDPMDIFGILVLYSKEKTQLRKVQIESGILTKRDGEYSISPDRDFLPFAQLHNIGVTIENLNVSISAENL